MYHLQRITREFMGTDFSRRLTAECRTYVNKADVIWTIWCTLHLINFTVSTELQYPKLVSSKSGGRKVSLLTRNDAIAGEDRAWISLRNHPVRLLKRPVAVWWFHRPQKNNLDNFSKIQSPPSNQCLAYPWANHRDCCRNHCWDWNPPEIPTPSEYRISSQAHLGEDGQVEAGSSYDHQTHSDFHMHLCKEILFTCFGMLEMGACWLWGLLHPHTEPRSSLSSTVFGF